MGLLAVKRVWVSGLRPNDEIGAACACALGESPEQLKVVGRAT